MTVRADFEGRVLSNDFGVLLVCETALHDGVIERLCRAMDDRRHPSYRHPSYVERSLCDMLTQRIFRMACGYPDANDSNRLRRDCGGNVKFRRRCLQNRLIYCTIYRHSFRSP